MDATFHPNQTQSPADHSSSTSYPFLAINAHHFVHYNDDDDLYHNLNSDYNPPRFIDPLPFPSSCQDSCYTNIPAYFTDIVQHYDPMTTNTCETSCILADTITCLPETDQFHDNILLGCRDRLNGESMNDGAKISLRVKTKLQVLDDGYRWRKYGKKKLKTTPNLRNYYKCSTIGCKVKKRVERDSSYLTATYIGIHNHQPIPSHIPPCTNCLTQLQTTLQFSS